MYGKIADFNVFNTDLYQYLKGLFYVTLLSRMLSKMKTKKKLTLKFYQNLGKLFYAVAASDNSVRKIEFDKLKELIIAQWLDLDSIEDNYYEDAAYQIEIVFDWLNSQKFLDATSCYNDFVNYKNEQKHLFSNSINKLIIKTAHAVANSFSGVNKSELILLAKLDLELKK
ncbi:hypothetical protein [Hyunsoonleella aestuarii]|uniref:TerB family tellurite resistance protein n=1 Tax=Hyunsoonleella aestuarii TaxID=912802 RepID=A0ABP8ECH3_9FLAO|nr:hypothetical protein [Hyunsoonleella aestuarii]